MRRIALIFMAIVMAAPLSFGQTTTPTLGLTLPPYAYPNWGVVLNSDLSLVDAAIGNAQLPYQGAWSSVPVYGRGAWVLYLGAVYASRINSNLNNLPTNTTAWQELPLTGSGSGSGGGTIALFVNSVLVTGSLSQGSTTINGGSL